MQDQIGQGDSVERWKRGPSGFTGKANRQLDQIEKLMIPAPRQVNPRALPDGPFLARITAIHDNYLECKREEGGSLVGDAFNVAKYPEVQKQEYDGKTLTDPTNGAVTWTFAYTGGQTRTVTNQDSDTEDQVIVPRYIPATGSWLGSRIIAVPSQSVVPGDGGADVTCPYLELTNRAFAKVAE